MPYSANMKNFSILIAALALIVSCTEKASVKGSVDGVSGEQLSVRRLEGNHYKTIDSVKTDAKGRYSFRTDIPKGEPQFIYIFRGDHKMASLLLQSGDRVSVQSDSLGNWSVKGSEECQRLLDVENAYSAFLAEWTGIIETSDNPELDLSRRYISYRKDRLSYVMGNTKSMSVLPVLFQNVNENLPVFNEPTDGILFSAVADSLKAATSRPWRKKPKDARAPLRCSIASEMPAK